MSDSARVEDDLGLAGKVAIVTGGGAPDDGIGNGRAAALLLARSGAKVVVVDIVREAADETVSMIAAEGGTALSVVADVADDSQCKALVQTTLREFGRLDLLDNNVGIGGRGSVVDTPVELWRRVMHVNVDSMFGDGRDRRRRRHRQRVVDLGIAASRPDRLFDLKGCSHCADPGDGG
jgi:NAD(P)-dependent dehydrogenase (short-subunit alcohol dehydrogenase family)